ncbi:MAG TPA: RecX family transcriptional regulator [Terracidiphilus sp.]|nr:RecX family transcriptional regulator [Terracidiphilus sp.]
MASGPRAGKAKPRLNESELYNYAVKALGRRMRTEVELRRLMHERAEFGERGEAAIEAVIKRLKEYKFLDDAAYAETYARLRQQNEKLGARRVRRDLAQKGLRSELINETVEARYGETNEEMLARQHLERKRIKMPENERETARVIRRLVAAGFSTGVIMRILRTWNVPEEMVAGIENIDAEQSGE